MRHISIHPGDLLVLDLPKLLSRDSTVALPWTLDFQASNSIGFVFEFSNQTRLEIGYWRERDLAICLNHLIRHAMEHRKGLVTSVVVVLPKAIGLNDFDVFKKNLANHSICATPAAPGEMLILDVTGKIKLDTSGSIGKGLPLDLLLLPTALVKQREKISVAFNIQRAAIQLSYDLYEVKLQSRLELGDIVLVIIVKSCARMIMIASSIENIKLMRRALKEQLGKLPTRAPMKGHLFYRKETDLSRVNEMLTKLRATLNNSLLSKEADHPLIALPASKFIRICEGATRDEFVYLHSDESSAFAEDPRHHPAQCIHDFKRLEVA